MCSSDLLNGCTPMSSRRVTLSTALVNNFNGQLTALSGNPWSYNNGLGMNLELFDGGRRLSEVNRIRATADQNCQKTDRKKAPPGLVLRYVQASRAALGRSNNETRFGNWETGNA